jgi:multidrug transporter EmrE-like cation transporter
MSRGIIVLILASVLTTACAQLFLKAGMSSARVQCAISQGISPRAIAQVAIDPLVVAGLFLYFGAALAWLFVLSKVQVSLAYPFVALGFVLTTLAGRFIFNEPLSSTRIFAVILICLGVSLLARS